MRKAETLTAAFAVLSLSCICMSALAASEASVGAPGVQFNESAPYSSLSEIARRSGYGFGAPGYDITQERFRVIIPETYNTNGDWGLFVWISPGQDGYIPPDWSGQLAGQRLLFVSALNSGNDRHPVDRMRLALDAVCNMCRKYKIDRRRIYVGGFSGGGRIASVLGVAYGNLFTGTLCVCGVNFYKEVPTGDGKQRYPATFYPDPSILSQARKNVRFVLLTGEFDENRDNTRATHESGFKAERFQRTLYLEVKGMKHAMPNAAVLKSALDFLSPEPQTNTGPNAGPDQTVHKK